MTFISLAINYVALIPILAVIAIIALLVVTNIKIVPQSKAYVIERLGAYHVTWQTGFHVKIPFIEKIAKTVSLKEQVVDFHPQPVITKDNVTMQIRSFSSRLQTPNFSATVLKVPFLLLRT